MKSLCFWLFVSACLASSARAQADGAAEAPSTPATELTTPGGGAAAPVGLPAYAPVYDPGANVQDLRAQLVAVQAERHELIDAGRPSYYMRRRILGFAALSLGVVGLAACGGLALFLGFSDEGPSNVQRGAMIAGVAGSFAVIGTGIWAIASTRGRNPYGERIRELRRAEGMIEHEIKRARRERRALEYSVVPTVSVSAGLAASLQLAVRM